MDSGIAYSTPISVTQPCGFLYRPSQVTTRVKQHQGISVSYLLSLQNTCRWAQFPQQIRAICYLHVRVFPDFIPATVTPGAT